MLKLILDNLYRTSTAYIPQKGNIIYWHTQFAFNMGLKCFKILIFA